VLTNTVDEVSRLRPIAVRLTTNARDLRASAWVRASTASTITEMRLRDALAGASPTTLSPRLQVRNAAGERRLSVAIDWDQDPMLLAREGSWVRISVATPTPDGDVHIRHQVVPAGTPEGDGLWRYEIPIDSFSGRAVVGVEALEVGVWSWGSLADAA